MSYREEMCHMIQGAVEDILRYTRAVSDDRFTWRPSEHARSVLEILQECVAVPLVMRYALLQRPQEPTDVNPFFAEASQLKTVAECEQALRANTNLLIEAIQNTPDSDLEQTVMLPWGTPAPIKRVISGHYWNLTYHLGQIAYIQLLYGDTNFY